MKTLCSKFLVIVASIGIQSVVYGAAEIGNDEVQKYETILGSGKKSVIYFTNKFICERDSDHENMDYSCYRWVHGGHAHLVFNKEYNKFTFWIDGGKHGNGRGAREELALSQKESKDFFDNLEAKHEAQQAILLKKSKASDKQISEKSKVIDSQVPGGCMVPNPNKKGEWMPAAPKSGK